MKHPHVEILKALADDDRGAEQQAKVELKRRMAELGWEKS